MGDEVVAEYVVREVAKEVVALTILYITFEVATIFETRQLAGYLSLL